MNWDAISAIAESMGTIAVVVTLVYLASQLRMANKQREQEASRDNLDRLNQLCELFSQSIEKASIINRGRKSLSSLSADERLIFEYIHFQVLNAIEGWYMQLMKTSRPGSYRDQQLDNIIGSIPFLLDHRGAREVWETAKHLYLPVQQLIDDTLSESGKDEV